MSVAGVGRRSRWTSVPSASHSPPLSVVPPTSIATTQRASVTERPRTARCAAGRRVAAGRDRGAHGEPLDADELGQRVAARALERRAGALDVGRERRRDRPERPDEGRAVRGADRPVAELERGVGLGRKGRGLADLERRLAREADAPARAEEDDRARGRIGQRRLERVLGVGRGELERLADVRAHEREHGRREAGLHERVLVDEVEDDRAVGPRGERGAADGRDRHGRRLDERLGGGEHLARRPRARQRHHRRRTGGPAAPRRRRTRRSRRGRRPRAARRSTGR